jgi:hypothetical protein
MCGLDLLKASTTDSFIEAGYTYLSWVTAVGMLLLTTKSLFVSAIIWGRIINKKKPDR